MLTYITGNFLITQIAEGIARTHADRGESVRLIFSGATRAEIDHAVKQFAHVVVCWQNCTPLYVPEPDFLISSVHPMTIVRAPHNIIEILGDFTNIGRFEVPPSMFNQPARNVSLTEGDGDYVDQPGNHPAPQYVSFNG